MSSRSQTHFITMYSRHNSSSALHKLAPVTLTTMTSPREVQMIFTNLTQTLGAIDAEVAELELFEQQRMELKTGREFFKQLLCPIQGDRS